MQNSLQGAENVGLGDIGGRGSAISNIFGSVVRRPLSNSRYSNGYGYTLPPGESYSSNQGVTRYDDQRADRGVSFLDRFAPDWAQQGVGIAAAVGFIGSIIRGVFGRGNDYMHDTGSRDYANTSNSGYRIDQAWMQNQGNASVRTPGINPGGNMDMISMMYQQIQANTAALTKQTENMTRILDRLEAMSS